MSKPIVWSIAGSDSGGGAGLQADVRTFHQLGVHGCSVVTAVTAQNSKEVTAVYPLAAAAIKQQLHTLAADMQPQVIKIGMIGSVSGVHAIAEFLQDYQGIVILDPVLKATIGGTLTASGAVQPIVNELLPYVDILTPNLPEAAMLLGTAVDSAAAVQEAASQLSGWGPHMVIIKGGHGQGTLVQDYVYTTDGSFWLSHYRLPHPHTHGTGCTFAASMAAAVALGHSPQDAAVIAKMFTTQAIRHGYAAGSGSGPVSQHTWPESEADLPWLTATAAAGYHRPHFPECLTPPMGLYPVVDTAVWVERLLALGVTTIQLRTKTLTGDALEAEILQAVALGRQYQARVFINDHWQLAIKHGAYGVHLGQEDLNTADVLAIAAAGLRLGISTHCYYEVARAHALQPSYIACGPIYETTIKQMPFRPQGLEALRRWRRTLSYPLVAIGGIDASHAAAVKATGVDAVALIRAIAQADDYQAATKRLLHIINP